MNSKQYAKKKGISERTARWRAQKGKAGASKPGGRDWSFSGGGPKKQRKGGRKKGK